MSSQQVPPQTQRKSHSHAVVESPENSMTNMIQGIDKNMIAIVAVAGVSIGLSFYLFREVKKIREDVKAVKASEVPDELQEKVDMNSNAINGIGTKLDQLISALSAQEQRRTQMMQQQVQPVQPVQQQVQQPVQPVVPVQQHEQVTEQVQVPMMGGSVIPPGEVESAQGPTINVQTDPDYSGPGVIKI